MRTILSISAILLIGGLTATLGWAAADNAADKAAVSQAAPTFSLSDQDGKAVNLADYAGKTIVLEWINPQCPFVVRHYEAKTTQNLAAKYKEKDVVWLAIDSTAKGTADGSKKWIEKYSLAYPILQDRDGKIGRQFGATNTPHMYIIDKAGKLVYAGALDSQPADSGPIGADTVNYVARALDEILAGQSVTTPQTKAYGCSVKYAK